MRCSSTAGALRGCLSTAAQVTPRLSDRPANTGVLLEVSGSELVVCGTDGETSITATLVVSGASPGSVLLAPRPLLGYLATLDDAVPVTVSLSDAEQLVVEPQGRSPYRFRPMSGSFTRPGGSRLALRAADLSLLARALKAVSPAASREHGGVQLVSTDDELVVNATDNYRLSHARLPGAGFGPFAGVVPLSVLELVARLQLTSVAADAKGTLIRFASESVSVVTRLLAVPFPPTEALLSSRGQMSVELPVVALRAALRPLELVAASRPLQVTVEGDLVTVTASNLEVGTGTEQVRCAVPASGPAFSFAVAAEYLRDVLVSAESETLTLWWSTPESALFFTSPAGTSPETVAVVMPQTL
jgi:DNA polymerase III sliding clamp (beta) subunit (PCNA family)